MPELSQKPWTRVVVGTLALIILGAYVAWQISGVSAPAKIITAADLGADTAADRSPDAPPTVVGWPQPQVGRSENQLTLSPTDGPVSLRMGGPGFYPPLEASSANGQVPVPSQVDQTDVETVEILANSGEYAFWGVVDLRDATHIAMQPAEPLAIDVVDLETGEALAARARVTLDYVSFLAQKVQAPDGSLRINVAPGTYRVAVSSPGYLRVNTRAQVPGSPLVVELSRGMAIHGVVRDANGPVAQAVVVAYQDTKLGVSIPRGATTADLFGRYRIDALPQGISRVEAVVDGYVPGAADVFEPDSEVDIVVVRGVNIRVTVVDSAQQPVRGALVRVGEPPRVMTGVTNAKGKVALAPVAPKASVFASLGGKRSEAVVVGAQDDEITLHIKELKRTLVRVLSRSSVRELRFEGRAGGRCSATQYDARDWAFRGCAGQDGAILVHTEHGVFKALGTLRDREIAVPSAVVLKVVPDPLVENARAFVTLQGQARPMDWDGAAFRARVLPGTYPIRVSAAGYRTWEDAVDVDADYELGVPLTKEEGVSVFVVDDMGAPVTGALVLVIGSDGRVQQKKRSSGQLPTQLTLAASAGAQVIAIDPRRGWGARSADTPDRVVLSQAILSAGFPGRTRDAMKADLGVVLQDDGRGARIVDPGRVPGLRRGDWLIGYFDVSNAKVFYGWREGATIEHVVKY